MGGRAPWRSHPATQSARNPSNGRARGGDRRQRPNDDRRARSRRRPLRRDRGRRTGRPARGEAAQARRATGPTRAPAGQGRTRRLPTARSHRYRWPSAAQSPSCATTSSPVPRPPRRSPTSSDSSPPARTASARRWPVAAEQLVGDPAVVGASAAALAGDVIAAIGRLTNAAGRPTRRPNLRLAPRGRT